MSDLNAHRRVLHELILLSEINLKCPYHVVHVDDKDPVSVDGHVDRVIQQGPQPQLTTGVLDLTLEKGRSAVGKVQLIFLDMLFTFKDIED